MVWLPALNFQDPATLQKNARKHAGRLPDPRALHYADPEGYAGKAYGKVMEIPYGAPAWDIYFAFGPEVRWEANAPAPDYWMHQLGGLDPESRLDGPKFAQAVGKLLQEANR